MERFYKKIQNNVVKTNANQNYIFVENRYFLWYTKRNQQVGGINMSTNNSNNNARKQKPVIIHEGVVGNAPSHRDSNHISKKAVSNPVPGKGGKKNK